MTFFWLPPPFRENSRKFRTFSIGRLPLAAWCRCGCLAGWPRARCWSGPPSAASTRPYQGTSSRCVGSRCGRQWEECDWEFRPLFSPHHPPGQDLLEVQCRCPCHLMRKTQGMCDLWLTSVLDAGCRVPKDHKMSSFSLRLNWAFFRHSILFLTSAVIIVLQPQGKSDCRSPQFFLKWSNYHEIFALWYSVYSPSHDSWRL